MQDLQKAKRIIARVAEHLSSVPGFVAEWDYDDVQSRWNYINECRAMVNETMNRFNE